MSKYSVNLLYKIKCDIDSFLVHTLNNPKLIDKLNR